VQIVQESEIVHDISPSLTQLREFNAKRRLKKAVLTVGATPPSDPRPESSPDEL
jgi:hypothetical protein